MKITPPYTPNIDAYNVNDGNLVDPIEYFIALIEMYSSLETFLTLRYARKVSKNEQKRMQSNSNSVLMQKIINLEQEINRDLETLTKSIN